MRITERKLRRIIRRTLLEAADPNQVEEVIQKYKDMKAQLGPYAGSMLSSNRNQFRMWAEGDDPVEELGEELAKVYAGWVPADFQKVLDSGCLD